MLVVLDQAEEGDVDPHLLEHGLDRGHVALAAVQQDQVRQAAEALGVPLLLVGVVLGEAPADDLPHGAVVVLAGDGLDFELAVGGFEGAAVFEHHHARHVLPALEVGDVVALDVGGDLLQAQEAAELV